MTAPSSLVLLRGFFLSFLFFLNVISCTNRLKQHVRKPLFKKFSHFLKESENRQELYSTPHHPHGSARETLSGFVGLCAWIWALCSNISALAEVSSPFLPGHLFPDY